MVIQREDFHMIQAKHIVLCAGMVSCLVGCGERTGSCPAKAAPVTEQEKVVGAERIEPSVQPDLVIAEEETTGADEDASTAFATDGRSAPATADEDASVASGETSSFADVINRNGVAVVKFAAEWCGPCKMYAPTFEAVSKELLEVEHQGNKVPVHYITLDIDKDGAVAQTYGVAQVPTTIFFKDGVVVGKELGGISKEILVDSITSAAKGMRQS